MDRYLVLVAVMVGLAVATMVFLAAVITAVLNDAEAHELRRHEHGRAALGRATTRARR